MVGSEEGTVDADATETVAARGFQVGAFTALKGSRHWNARCLGRAQFMQSPSFSRRSRSSVDNFFLISFRVKRLKSMAFGSDVGGMLTVDQTG